MKKIWLCLVVGCFLLTLGAGPAGAKMTIKYGHVAPPFHGQSKGIEAFAKYVNEKTNGEIVVRTFPMGQLGSERSMAEQVQTGVIAMAAITTAVMQNYVPQAAVLDLPFIWPSREVCYAVLDDPEWQKKLFSYLPSKGFIGIGWTENEFRDINNTKHPIRTPKDLEGLKIRVMNSPVYIETFKQLGASPVGIPFPELYNALQQGVIDAQDNPLYTSILIKVTEVAKYVTKTEHTVTECIQIVNPDFWEKLTPAQQQIFRDAAKIAIKVNRESNAKAFKKLPKLGISIEEYCEKNNVQVVRLTDEERAAFKKAVQPVLARYRKIVGEDLFDFLMNKISEHEKALKK
ncbi:MAG: TRAP transporter substrate-binding protein DctP [Deltaproteobacteria bacterium]|nr:TRAP transporter substrate-binding protein DctP [Deltaproteobacteria bacterium]MBW2017202.1 TRAP transporter substrate-binding protein DctP [Deltaproteobacteria bacterium]MBW2129274.1 TRAP transporter substrate-binding protein DctP [Deltaproteobacteria bacterium]MBW2303976.1 TRAP transporter substrate-binding protein DctP [Deltaproteobacteria bacterium]